MAAIRTTRKPARRRSRWLPRSLSVARALRIFQRGGLPVEFVDVVMKRRAVRRFEEGGVEPTSSSGSPGSRSARRRRGSARASAWSSWRSRTRRREVARLLARRNTRTAVRAVDLGMRRPVHPVRLRADLSPPLPGARQGRGGRQRGRVADPVLVGRRRRDDAERDAGGGERGAWLRVRRHGRGGLEA